MVKYNILYLFPILIILLKFYKTRLWKGHFNVLHRVKKRLAYQTQEKSEPIWLQVTNISPLCAPASDEPSDKQWINLTLQN